MSAMSSYLQLESCSVLSSLTHPGLDYFKQYTKSAREPMQLSLVDAIHRVVACVARRDESLYTGNLPARKQSVLLHWATASRHSLNAIYNISDTVMWFSLVNGE